LIDRKRATCKERAAKTGAIAPLNRYNAADGPFPGITQWAGAKVLWALSRFVGVFINLPSSSLRTQVPLACPSKQIYRCNRALAGEALVTYSFRKMMFGIVEWRRKIPEKK
jgi:hypothetical protein